MYIYIYDYLYLCFFHWIPALLDLRAHSGEETGRILNAWGDRREIKGNNTDDGDNTASERTGDNTECREKPVGGGAC